ncbi:hypothetical protein JXA05_04535 [Candidatus Peregrinibacteria bacterium]|nr:hypothetical protein [Candidatus Peregrinibacteria bacterium]
MADQNKNTAILEKWQEVEAAYGTDKDAALKRLEELAKLEISEHLRPLIADILNGKTELNEKFIKDFRKLVTKFHTAVGVIFNDKQEKKRRIAELTEKIQKDEGLKLLRALIMIDPQAIQKETAIRLDPKEIKRILVTALGINESKRPKKIEDLAKWLAENGKKPEEIQKKLKNIILSPEVFAVTVFGAEHEIIIGNATEAASELKKLTAKASEPSTHVTEEDLDNLRELERMLKEEYPDETVRKQIGLLVSAAETKLAAAKTPKTPAAPKPAPAKPAIQKEPVILEQEEKIRKAIGKIGLTQEETDAIRAKIDVWNRADKTDYFQDADKIRAACKMVQKRSAKKGEKPGVVKGFHIPRLPLSEKVKAKEIRRETLNYLRAVNALAETEDAGKLMEANDIRWRDEKSKTATLERLTKALPKIKKALAKLGHIEKADDAEKIADAVADVLREYYCDGIVAQFTRKIFGEREKKEKEAPLRQPVKPSLTPAQADERLEAVEQWAKTGQVPKAPAVTTPHAPAAETAPAPDGLPENMPENIRGIAARLTEKDPRGREAFKKAWQIAYGKTAEGPTAKKYREQSRQWFDAFQSLPTSEIEPKIRSVKDLIAFAKKVDWKTATENMEKEKEIGRMRELIHVIAMEKPELESLTDNLLRILETDPKSIANRKARALLYELQNDILYAMEHELPEAIMGGTLKNKELEAFNKKPLAEKTKAIRKLRLRQKAGREEAVLGVLKTFEKFVERWKEEETGALPAATPSAEEGQEEEGQKREETPEEREVSSLKISDMIKSVLEYPRLYRKEDPAVMAIKHLISDKKLDIKALTAHLKKPSTIKADALTAELAEKNNPEQLDTLLKKAEWDLEDTNKKIATAVKRGKDANEERAERREIRNRIDRIKTAKGLKAGRMKYPSAWHVLAMANMFAQGNTEMSENKLFLEVENQIAAQRETAYGPINLFRKIWSPLKPTLTATLKSLAETKQFKKFGITKEQMAGLAEVDDATKMNSWIEGFEPQEKAMGKAIPHVIAYLEYAIRDAKTTYLNMASRGSARHLLELLKNARHEYAMEQVKDKLAGDTEKSDLSRMLLYFREMEKLMVKQDRIETDFIRSKNWKTIAKRALGLGALGGGGYLALPALAALPSMLLPAGVAALPYGVARYLTTKVDDPGRAKWYKIAANRTLAFSAVAGAAATLGLGPLGAALFGLGGLGGKEIYKGIRWVRGKKIAEGSLLKGTGKAAKGAAKGIGWTAPKAWWLGKNALLTGMTGGVYPFYKIYKWLKK